MSQAGKISMGSGGAPVESITGNSGGAVGPDGAGNITLIGSGEITVIGTPGVNTATISIINGTNGQVLVGGGAAAAWTNITSAGGTITIAEGANTINLEAAAIIATTHTADAGSALPAASNINVLGGTNMNTSGATDILTIHLDTAVAGLTSLDMGSGGRIGTSLLAGNAALFQAYDVDGASYTTFATLTANNTPTMDLDEAVTKSGGYIYRAGGTDVPVADGGTGSSSLTDHAVIVGSGVAAVTPLAAATDGQLVIGSTGNDPSVAALTAGVGVSITNAAGSITIDAGGVDQSNIYYVGKHGNDANDGLTIEKAFLTFGAAISAASSGDVVWCSDEGTYVENITGAPGVNIFAPNVTLTGEHTITTNEVWTIYCFNVLTSTTGITLATAGEHSHINAEEMIIAGDGVGVVSTDGKLFVRIQHIEIEDTGFFVGSTTSDEMYIIFRELEFGGAGTAFAAIAGAELNVWGNCVQNGAGGDGEVFLTFGGGTPQVNAHIVHIHCDKLSTITGPSEVRLVAATLHGTLAESGGGTVIVSGSTRIDSVPIGAAVPSTGAFTTLSATTPIDVPSGGTGVGTLTDHGVLLGSGVGAITPLGVATDGQLIVGSTGADPVIATVTSTDSTIDITGGAGTLDLDLSTNVQNTAIHSWNGSVLETPAVTVTSDGAVITLSIEKAGTGNLTVNFSDGFYTWVTAPDTVTLTAGADISPTLNYVYLLQSTKTLTASTVSFPAAEHFPVATVLCQSAASLAGEGAYKVHAWTDHTVDADNQGHISDLNSWIRHQNATWMSGVGQTLTITPQGAAPDNVIFTSAAGIVMQLHHHTFPAFAGTPDVYTVNDSVAAYNIVTDLNELLLDSAGGSMANKYFTLVIWGVVNEATGDCKLMVNLPGGSYNTATLQAADSSNYTNYTIPGDFVGTGFLISELQLRQQAAAGGTWTSVDEINLLGELPSRSAGGSTSFATTFPDNAFIIYDDGDVTKQLAFQCSSIATTTTRTITMDDRDIDMDAVATTLATDSGNAVPAAGIGTVAGGTNMNTAGAGSTVTVNLDGSPSIAGTFSLPSTNAGGTAGIILFNSLRYIHEFGTDCYWYGEDSGNLTHTGLSNIGIGSHAMNALTTGDDNIAIGLDALGLIAGGDDNIAIGSNALDSATSAARNIAIGANGTLGAITNGSDNIAIGNAACFTAGASLNNIHIGTDSGSGTATVTQANVAVGHQTLTAIDGGSWNTIIGTQAGNGITTGDNNVTVGYLSLDDITTGDDNIAIGTLAAGSLTLADSDNIIIGNAGSAGLGNTIIIGTQGTGAGQQDTCFIHGIYNTTPAVGTVEAVIIDSSGQLGTTNAVAMTWNHVTGTSSALAVNNGYIADNAGLVTLTLPATAVIGTRIGVVGQGAGGWIVAQNAGQAINIGGSTTTVGVGGSLASSAQFDCIEIICTATDTTWVVRSSMGNITVV